VRSAVEKPRKKIFKARFELRAEQGARQERDAVLGTDFELAPND
jgi:hypothetical protein